MKNNKLYYVLTYAPHHQKEQLRDIAYEDKNKLIYAINICIKLNYIVNNIDVCVWLDGKLTPINKLKEFGGVM